jgi:hypothetical protein
MLCGTGRPGVRSIPYSAQPNRKRDGRTRTLEPHASKHCHYETRFSRISGRAREVKGLELIALSSRQR